MSNDKPISKGPLSRARWAYGVMTVPSRLNEVLPRTLISLANAGFPRPHLFVDGETDPGKYLDFRLPFTLRPPPALGPFGNWTLGMWELFIRDPECTHYAMFQDDILCCKNLRQYLEKCKYPEKGYWNLNTFPSVQPLAPGYNLDRNYLGDVGWFLSGQNGRSAAGLVFNREALMLVLGHRHTVEKPASGQKARVKVDGSIVECFARSDQAHGYSKGWREYCHNPSLITHRNEPSTIHNPKFPVAGSFRGEDFDALSLLSQEEPKAPVTVPPTPTPKSTRIGLVGYNAPCGLGTKNRQLATYLPVDRWLVKPHRSGRMLPAHPDVDTVVCPMGDNRKIEEFVRSVDVVLFDETPYYNDLIPLCKRHERRLVCIPEYEWLPERGWPQQIDLFLCPTRQSYDLLHASLPCVYAPWPVDVNAFTYQQRTMCERFLFVNGTGGWRGRKGAETIRRALSLWSEIPLTIRTQRSLDFHLSQNTPNVKLLGSAEDNSGIYNEGDVLLCPHSVDGTGLEPLEALACGMPVIATNGLPWNELPVIGRIKATVERRHVNREVDWYVPSAESLILQCKGWLGKSLAEQSENAWRWARDHRWDKAAADFTDLVLRGEPCDSAKQQPKLSAV